MSIAILGGIQTDFARVWSREGLDLSDMLGAVTRGALADAGVRAGDIGTIHVGNAFGELQRGQAHLGAMISDLVPELWGVPASRHEGACASGSLALLAATAEIEAGRYDVALVIGAEEFKNTAGDVASQNQNAASWQGREEIDCRFMWPAAFGLVGAEYQRRYGIERRHLNHLSEQAYQNARKNPLAQTRAWSFAEGKFSEDDILNPVIEPGTRRQDCAQITDGAAAIVIASEAFAADHARRTGRAGRAGRTGRDAAAFARITGWGHTTAGIRLKPKLERSRDEALIFPHVAQAAIEARRRAGITSVFDLDVIETHDCFSHTAYMAIDHLGITAPGENGRAIDDGLIAPGGRLPFNPGGGLIGCGHPVGATGVRMVLDAARQVTASAGAIQVEGARRVQTLNIGGSASTIVSFIVAAD
jgi:acetyl-CoA C-acetyltransferase